MEEDFSFVSQDVEKQLTRTQNELLREKEKLEKCVQAYISARNSFESKFRALKDHTQELEQVKQQQKLSLMQRTAITAFQKDCDSLQSRFDEIVADCLSNCAVKEPIIFDKSDTLKNPEPRSKTESSCTMNEPTCLQNETMNIDESFSVETCAEDETLLETPPGQVRYLKQGAALSGKKRGPYKPRSNNQMSTLSSYPVHYQKALEHKQRDPSITLKQLKTQYGVRPATMSKYWDRFQGDPNNKDTFTKPKRGPKFVYFDHDDVLSVELKPRFPAHLERKIQDAKPPSPATLRRAYNSLPSDIRKTMIRTSPGDRTNCSNEEKMIRFYLLLDLCLEKYGLRDSPERIWNCDEVGIAVDQRKLHLVTSRKSLIRRRFVSEGNHVTAMFCANGVGDLAPSAWIVQGTTICGDYFNGISEEDMVAVSKKGFITDEIFKDWVGKFLAFLHSKASEQTEDKFSILITDGHQSRLNHDLMWSLLNEKVLVLCLPAHTTHLLQPNDFGLNKTFKSNLDSILGEFISGNIVVDKTLVCSLAYRALHCDNIRRSISESFRHIGIYPFDSSKKDVLLANMNTSEPSSVVAKGMVLIQEQTKMLHSLLEFKKANQGKKIRKQKNTSLTADAQLLTTLDNINLIELMKFECMANSMLAAELLEFCKKELQIPDNELYREIELKTRTKVAPKKKDDLIKVIKNTLKQRQQQILEIRKKALQERFHTIPPLICEDISVELNCIDDFQTDIAEDNSEWPMTPEQEMEALFEDMEPSSETLFSPMNINSIDDLIELPKDETAALPKHKEIKDKVDFTEAHERSEQIIDSFDIIKLGCLPAEFRQQTDGMQIQAFVESVLLEHGLVYDCGGGGDCGPLSFSAGLNWLELNGRKAKSKTANELRALNASITGRYPNPGDWWNTNVFEVLSKSLQVSSIICVQSESDIRRKIWFNIVNPSDTLVDTIIINCVTSHFQLIVLSPLDQDEMSNRGCSVRYAGAYSEQRLCVATPDVN